MLHHLRVALLIESSRGYGRKLLQGIAAYARTHGPWAFFHEERDLGAPLPKNLKQWRPDGIIARLSGEKLIRQVRELGLPTVDLYLNNDTQGIPCVAAHHEAIVALAIDHFLERGFRHFAFCGFPGVGFSDLRAGCFQQALAGAGSPPITVPLPAIAPGCRSGPGRGPRPAARRRTGQVAAAACPSRWPCWPATTCAGSR